ncbi:EF-hand domain-containing protein [Lentzea sp. NPDC051213]|uniref:EF-hand domain-containing protein n=1 Tax=Lentzea sp. NPDC051213 TaxID=3364126 RepID=UPI0037BBF1D0
MRTMTGSNTVTEVPSLEPTRDVRAVKIGKEFDHVDTDRDNITSLEDWDEFVDYMCSQFDVDSGSPAGLRLHESVRRRWQAVTRSVQGQDDHKLTRGEYVSYFCETPPSACADLVLDHADAVFVLCDRDADGHLNRQEFVALLRAYGVREAELAETMNRIGLRDGRVLSKARYADLAMNFCFSTDALTPGSWLMGRV